MKEKHEGRAIMRKQRGERRGRAESEDLGVKKKH